MTKFDLFTLACFTLAVLWDFWEKHFDNDRDARM